VQVHPTRPTLKAPGIKRLKLKSDELLSNLPKIAFSFNLRRSIKGLLHRLFPAAPASGGGGGGGGGGGTQRGARGPGGGGGGGGGITDAEVSVFLALLDADGDGAVTLREIIECIKSLRGTAAAEGGDAEHPMTDAMLRLARIVSEKRSTVVGRCRLTL